MVRRGILTPKVLEILRQCCRPLPDLDSEVKATNLYPTRTLADEENCREFDLLETPVYSFTAVDSSNEDILRDLHAAENISLRVGAQVMLLANLNVREGLVNGTRGIVTGFAAKDEIQRYLQQIGDDFACGMRVGKSYVFPKVLFETKDTTKEVRHPSGHTNVRL